MDNACGQDCFFKNGERGASRLKFILVIAIIAVAGYIGYQYIPVAYQASRFKIAMQDAVRTAAAGQSNEQLQNQLRAAANEWDVPPDAKITVERSAEGHIQARVQYTRPIVLPGYTYTYKFDYTAKNAEWLDGK